MRRILGAGLLALPLMLVLGQSANAQGVGCNTPGGCGASAGYGGGYGAGFGAANCGYGFGASLVRFRLFPCIHQEGPLVNYGPYSGYYPFEPYGPWTSDLRYTGPTGKIGSAATGRLRIGDLSGGGRSGFGGVRHSPCGTCSSGHNWGSYAVATLGNIGHRINPWANRGCGTCSSCHSAIQPDSDIRTASAVVNER